MATTGSASILILPDTSAWIDFFHKVEPLYSRIGDILDTPSSVCCSGLVVAELLQGAASEKELHSISDFTCIFDFLPEGVEVWKKAGRLSHLLARKGVKVGLADCYLAVQAIDANAQILSKDRHFAVIQKHSSLKLSALRLAK